MNYIRNLNFSVVVLLLSLVGQKADFPKDLEKWFSTDPPKVSTEQWIIAQGDLKTEWVVSSDESTRKVPKVMLRGEVQNNTTALPFMIKPIRNNHGFHGSGNFTKVENGFIISFNNGEFGAELWWFSKDGEQQYKISEDHVLSYFHTKSGLLTLEGLAHAFGEKGRIGRLRQDDQGKWVIEPFFTLEDVPHVGLKIEDDKLIIATSSQLLRFEPIGKKVDIIVDNLSWSGLYPNSIAATKVGDIYVGMRHGVSRIAKNGNTFKVFWLLPSKDIADQKLQEGFR